jgi:hypothetical protein
VAFDGSDLIREVAFDGSDGIREELLYYNFFITKGVVL